MSVWIISGSDPSGGAGLQADLRTCLALGVEAQSCLTAVTAQNHERLLSVNPVAVSILHDQLTALARMPRPSAIKIGLVPNAEIAEKIAEFLEPLSLPVIWDPVGISSSGGQLSKEGKASARILKKHVTLVTPNQDEREIVSDFPSQLLKSDSASDVIDLTGEKFWLKTPRLKKGARGTGCTLSTAIAVGLSQGHSLVESIVRAKLFLQRELRLSQELLRHFDFDRWELYENEDFPELSRTSEEEGLFFPRMSAEELGFYPIVDSLELVDIVTRNGAKLVQLRIKEETAMRAVVESAAEICRERNCKLIVNDFEELAIAVKAYGVHLGQSDLKHANLRAISQAGLRLGISTHNFEEVAVANALRPSYVAIGPIYPTTTKTMPHAPQGLEGLRRWRALLPYPLVAIAGITLEGISEVLEAGADGIAVVRDVTQAQDVGRRCREWALKISGARLKPRQSISRESGQARINLPIFPCEDLSHKPIIHKSW